MDIYLDAYYQKSDMKSGENPSVLSVLVISDRNPTAFALYISISLEMGAIAGALVGNGRRSW